MDNKDQRIKELEEENKRLKEEPKDIQNREERKLFRQQQEAEDRMYGPA